VLCFLNMVVFHPQLYVDFMRARERKETVCEDIVSKLIGEVGYK